MMRTILATVLLITLTACSSGDPEPTESTPTPGFEVPTGLTLSEPGTEVEVGTSLAVAHPRADDSSGTALALKVASIRKVPRRDLGLYSIPAGTVPRYVDVVVGNRGPHEARFEDGPWWAHLSGDVLLPPTRTPGGLSQCRAPRIGRTMAAGEVAKGCLLFLVPKGSAIRSIDFQPGDVTTAVRWLP